jgi:predicted amidohydrolase/acetyl-CoA carboxylase alpha subunit
MPHPARGSTARPSSPAPAPSAAPRRSSSRSTTPSSAARIGPVAGEKIALAFDLAAARRLPLVLLCAAGVAARGGALALWQAPKLAAAAARLHRAGIPVVGVLAHPTAGAVWGALLTQADVTLAEPGAGVEFGSGQPGPPEPGAGLAGSQAARDAALLGIGALDGIVERSDLAATLARLLALFADRGDIRSLARERRHPRSVPEPAPRTLFPAWERAELVRHPERPGALALLRLIVTDWVELGGDRLSGDDPAIVCGLGRLAGAPLAVVAQRRDRPASAVAWRKAARLLRLAGHLELPTVALLDAPPEADAPAAEAAARLAAVGALLGLVPLLPTPLVAAVVGESGGPGAAALAAGDRTLMLEHALLRTPGSERRGSGPAPHDRPGEPLLAAAATLSARDALRLGLVDLVVAEPAPGAHADPDRTAALLADALAAVLADLAAVAPRRLLEERNRRIRSLGLTTPEGRDAARHEVLQWQEAQQTLARSLADLRGRWQAAGRMPRLSRPTRPPLAARPTRPSFGRRSDSAERRRPDLADLVAALGRAEEPRSEEPRRERGQPISCRLADFPTCRLDGGPAMTPPPPPPFRVAAIQFDPTMGAKSANVDALLGLCEAAAAGGARLIVTPEMATVGYCWHDRAEVAPEVEPIPGPTTDQFAAFAARTGAHVVLGLAEVAPDTGVYYNSAPLIGPAGVLGVYRKTHAFIADPKWAKDGDLGLPVWETALGRIAIVICMDAAYPETTRIPALAGADVVCFPTNWLGEKAPSPSWLARAAESGLYLIAANRSGLERGVRFDGGSCVVDPDGAVQSWRDAGDGVVFGEVDPGPRPCQTARPGLPARPARRPPPGRLRRPQPQRLPLGCPRLPRPLRHPAAAGGAAEPGRGPPGRPRARRPGRQPGPIEAALDTEPAIELLVAPELALTGEPTDAIAAAAVAEPVDGPSVARLAEIARERGCWVVAGLVERGGERLFNTAVLVGPEGLAGRYRKLHLADADRRGRRRATPGWKPSTPRSAGSAC